jgi:hypothetical protein
MATVILRYLTTRDGGRPRDQVDPSKIVRPNDDDNGKHSGGSSGAEDDRKDESDR